MADILWFAWSKVASVGAVSFQPTQSAWIFVLHFWYQRNYKCFFFFFASSTSKYGSGLCTLYFSNQLS